MQKSTVLVHDRFMGASQDVLYLKVLLSELSIVWQRASLEHGLLLGVGETPEAASSHARLLKPDGEMKHSLPLAESELELWEEAFPHLKLWCQDVSKVSAKHRSEVFIAKQACRSYDIARALASDEVTIGSSSAWIRLFLEELRSVLVEWRLAEGDLYGPLLGPLAAALIMSPLHAGHPIQLAIVPGIGGGSVFQVLAYAAGIARGLDRGNVARELGLKVLGSGRGRPQHWPQFRHARAWCLNRLGNVSQEKIARHYGLTRQRITRMLASIDGALGLNPAVIG